MARRPGRADSPAVVPKVEREISKPVMPIGFKANIPNAITALVIMSGCTLMVSIRPETSIHGYRPWWGIVTAGSLPGFGVVIVIVGLVADILDGTAARFLQVGTKFGSYFDELSDLTAFGIGPAVYLMRYCMEDKFDWLVFLAGYAYMLASVYRISRELVVHRGSRPKFFVGVTTNMASLILVVAVFLSDRFGLTRWLPVLVFPLTWTMVRPKKHLKDPTCLFLSYDEQCKSMHEAEEIEEEELHKERSKPVMPVGFKAQIPNLITAIVILSGCILMTAASVLGWKPWKGMVVVFIGLIADILDGTVARRLGVGTKFGAYFDELSDLTAFGIGPAVYFMRHCIDNGGSFMVTCAVGYLYMLASVYRISRELVVHRGLQPKFFVGITTNMASAFLVVFVFAFDALGISEWLPVPVLPLSILMVVPRKFYKDPTGLLIDFEVQRRSMEEADELEKNGKAD